MKGQIISAGEYRVQHFRRINDEMRLIDEEVLKNIVVNEGLNDLLAVYLQGGTQKATWYLGVFEGNYTPVATDTAATIAASATESSAYTGGTRKTWMPAAPSGQSITNAANRGNFVFNATKTIYGAFLISTSTINGTSGTLFSAARFATAKNVVNTDELLLTYSFSASSA